MTKTILGTLEKYVLAVNTLDRPNPISDPLLPNGCVTLAPGEVYSLPAQVWGQKFRQYGLRRATPEDQEEWLNQAALEQAGVEAADDISELEDTRLDRLREMADELGIIVKGNKAQVVLAVRAGLLAKMVSEHDAMVLETIAQGAYEYERAASIKGGADVPSWPDAPDKAKADAIARASKIITGTELRSSEAFRETMHLIASAGGATQ